MGYYDAVLERWPVPYQRIMLPTRCGNTFIIASGEETFPPLILLHGASSNSSAWVADFPEFTRYFRVYAVDIPGEAGKSTQNRPSWNGPAYAEWLEDVLDGLQIEKAVLLGISQGGWMALKFAVCYPERVRKLVLLAPGGVVPARASFLLRAIPLSFLGRWGAEKLNRIVFGRQPMDAEAIQIMDAILTYFKPRIEKQPIFTDEELLRLKMPTLLVAGEQDALIDPVKTAQRLRALLPDLQVKLLPDTGHVLHHLAEEITPFL